MFLQLNFTRARLYEPEKRRFDAPITAHQVSNVIHALFGEVPVSSIPNKEAFHKKQRTFHKRNEALFEKAKNSYIRIDSSNFHLPNKKDEIKFITEFGQNEKIVSNSNIKYYLPYSWDYFRLIIIKKVVNYDAKLKEFEIILKQYGVDEDSLTFIDFLNHIFKIGKPKLFLDFIKSFGSSYRKSPFIGIFNDVIGHYQYTGKIPKNAKENNVSYQFGDFLLDSTLNRGYANISSTNDIFLGGRNLRGISNYSTFFGKLLIPVTNDDLEIIRRNTGTASILDGGIVTIDEVVSTYDIDLDEYTSLSEISTELIEIKIKKIKK